MNKKNIKKVLLLGSGGLKIGQAGEFDYSGTQAIKALKEENIEIILINPNIATIQTSEGFADKVYFLPVTPYFVEEIIKKEKPQGIVLSFGGQTALNCGLILHKNNVLKKHNVQVLGTKIESIEKTEDRGLFVKTLNEIDVRYPISKAVTSVKAGISAAKKIGYPVMLRAAFALGGKGSGICKNDLELKKRLEEIFCEASQALVEEWLGGWKEIEYEVVRDSFDNCITVCNMENFDPLGIHTGESIVVAPSQTLSNSEYHKLRDIAIKVIRHLGIVGECNIQYALDPFSEDYRVIEVNARLSRSSALASKATGYPLAFVAAKLSLGHSLTEIKNSITQKTYSCFEPALDYVVVKMPRWDLKKFKEVNKLLGSEMKSVGEVMSIGRTFEESIQKALRMISVGMHGLTQNTITFENLKLELKLPTDRRIFAIGKALKENFSIDKIYDLTKIDRWFLCKLKNIIDCEKALESPKNLKPDLLIKAKKMGFSDYQIAKIRKSDLNKIRNLRKKNNIFPFVKQIDTLAAEYPANTNYLYLTYNAAEHDISPSNKGIIILGGGAYRIGSSVEFDWCCVNAVMSAKDLGHKTIMINYNPETVSTDYDICDRLYFDEMTFERVLDIYEFENPKGVIVSMGGQIPNNLSIRLHKAKVKILGTSPINIDKAEDRHKFSSTLDKLSIDQPEWKELTSIKEAKIFANIVSYPVLIRPSYVLSGASMNVVWDNESLTHFLKEAAEVNPSHPVVISKFIENSKEIEVDAVSQNGEIICYAISEHVENAGVHSGDATIVLPAQRLYIETIRRVKKILKEIAFAFEITGPFNIQLIAENNNLKVIECNLRASRSFPFCSKVYKQNFIKIATNAILGKKQKPVSKSAFDLDYVGVKAAQFSFSRLKGADPTLGVEMASTGEVGCIGQDLNEAFLKAFLATGFKIPKKNILVSAGPIASKTKLLEPLKKLKSMGYFLFGTPGTSLFYKNSGLSIKTLNWPLSCRKPNIKDYLIKQKVDWVINIPKNNLKEELKNDYLIRRMAIDYEIPLTTNLQVTIELVDSIEKQRSFPLEIKHWAEY